jgi:ribonuclease R
MLTQDQKSQVFQFIRSLKAKAFTFRDVVRFLDLDSDQRRNLQHFLDELDSQQIIHRLKRGRYTLPERENLASGILHCHRDGYGFLLPEDRTLHKEDIFIPARGMGGALHEDRVIVKLVRKKPSARRGKRGRRIHAENRKERTEGYVVRVLERKRPSIVGKYFAHPRHPYVVPLDSRIIHDIQIPYHANKGATDGQLVVATITLPPDRNQAPQGEITEILGNAEDPGIEYKIVVHKFGLAVDFSPESLREAAALPDHVLKKEYEGREDFRNELIITIDGETARDFDDAVSLKILASGNFLLGVHISDVSHYVREGTALDLEAYARGTSVYFPDRAVPMLPPRISGGICSLKPDCDRLVLSVLIEIDHKGNILASRFTKGVLRSCQRMTYTSVARILAHRKSDEKARYAELIPLLESMAELCMILSKKR